MKKLEETGKVREVPKDFHEQQAQHWDLRYGGMVKDRNKWMAMAFMSFFLSIVLAIGYIKTVSDGKYIPYMITAGELGTAVSLKPASRVGSINHRMIEATLGRFIYCFRTVSIDKGTLKHNVDELYSMLNSEDPAYNKLTQHFRDSKNDPYKRAKTMVTSIDISSVMNMPSGEWIVKWREDVFTRKGKLLPDLSGTYQAIISVIVIPASINNEEEMRLPNPLGIYVRDISWKKEKN
jgi:type IV secretory pathway TrbF-like protein